MPESAKFILVISFLTILLCFIKMIRSGHFFKAFTLSAFSGISSLFAVNLVTFITGISISINWFTLIFCTFTGISGSFVLLILNTLKNI